MLGDAHWPYAADDAEAMLAPVGDTAVPAGPTSALAGRGGRDYDRR